MNDELQVERSRETGKCIATAVADVLDAPVDKMLSRLASCKTQMMALATSDSERLEVDRRVAEARISLLWKKEDETAFQAAWSEMEALGYSDVEREATMLVYRLMFDARQGATIASAQRGLDRLAEVTQCLPPAQAAHFDSVLARLRASMDPG